MKQVRITCPHCRADNLFDLRMLPPQGGHLACQHCQQIFKISPKKKPAPTPAATHTPTHTASSFQEVADRPHSKPDTQKMAAAIHAIRMNLHQHNAPPATEQPANHRPFTILDHQPNAVPQRQSGALAVPSLGILLKQDTHSALPTVSSASLPFSLIDPEPEPKPASTRIHIETGNLVFTLLPNPAEQNPALVLSDPRVHSEEITATQLALAHQQENLHRQFNWTLASLVALTVLIVQLFYLMSLSAP